MQETIDNVDRVLKRVLLVLSPRLDDYLPLLSPFFTKQRKDAMAAREEQMRTLVLLIDRRRTELMDSKHSQSYAYLDTLFDLKIEGRKSSPTDAELVTLCSEFINGGTDTTATAIEWAIARLIENPGIQARLFEEIRSTVGERKVSESDLDKMEYLNAFTKELLRKHPPTHMSLTHAAVELTTLAGYDIPPDANVDFYLPPISENARHWSDPAAFRPERFLAGEDADMTGVKEVKMMPFGIGRRICPGLGMATVHVNLMVARMVQEFEWFGHPSQLPLDFSEKVEFTVVMEKTLMAVVKPRSTPMAS